MANPLYNLLNGTTSQGGIQQQFDNFRRTVQGDPKAMVQQLMNNGQMSQQQFNQLSQMANLLKGTLK